MITKLAIFTNFGTFRRATQTKSAATLTRNVNLTDALDSFVLAKVASGGYENASEAVHDALRTLECNEREYETKLMALRAAIDAGDASRIAELRGCAGICVNGFG